MSAMANALLGLAQSWGSMRGRELQVTVDGSFLRFSFDKNTDRDDRMADDYYQNGAIYHRDYAEPIIITKDEAESINLTRRAHVKHFMEQRIFREATNTQAADFDLHAKLLAGVIVSILILTVVVVAVMA